MFLCQGVEKIAATIMRTCLARQVSGRECWSWTAREWVNMHKGNLLI